MSGDLMRGRHAAPGTPGSSTASALNTMVFVSSDKNSELVYSAGPMDQDNVETIKEKLLRIQHVDFKPYLNGFHHNTLDYERVKTFDLEDSHLVIRRGQEFVTKLYFNRPYNKEEDNVSLVLTFGSKPKPNDGTQIVLPLNGESHSKNWGVKIYRQKDNRVSLRVQIPPICCIGKWQFMVTTSPKLVGGQPARLEWNYTKPIYILFNPWCEKDAVFHPDDAFRKEYVLADRGGIYAGRSLKRWNFGQFDINVLDCVLWVLDNRTPKLKAAARTSPVQIARKLTAVVNSCDNRGMLTGNWSGDYSGGTSPTEWTGSVEILKQYFQSKSPVEFGQCWVFSGVLTTCLRALGIPARSVTNYSSAHDTDGSLTIDKYIDADGEPIESLSSDSIWNFHVWNDAWMTRPDLKAEYALPGWQACDATPQETSNGIYCCGPCPLAAIKEGYVDLPYDGPFIFSEVNGDVVYWEYVHGKPLKCVRISKNSVGKVILTYKANDEKMDDVTYDYKYRDAKTERLVMKRACCHVDEANIKDICIYDDINLPQPSVELKFEEVDSVMYGDTYSIVLNVKNISKEKKNVTVTLGSRSIFYTGLFYKKVMFEKIEDSLNAGEEKTFKRDISFDIYEPAVADRCFFEIHGSCKVKETGETKFDGYEFELRKPVMTVVTKPDKLEVGKKATVEVSFINSLPINLSRCTLTVEGMGLQPTRKFNIPGTVGPKQTFKFEFDIHPFKTHGTNELVVNFNSKEMYGIEGSCILKVESLPEPMIVDSDDED